MLSVKELKEIRKSFNNKKEVFLTNYFKALGDINRHRIFQLLSAREKMLASDIAATLNISRPLASQHLKILEQAQLFKKEKIGKNKFYKLDWHNPFIRSLIHTIKKIG